MLTDRIGQFGYAFRVGHIPVSRSIAVPVPRPVLFRRLRRASAGIAEPPQAHHIRLQAAADPFRGFGSQTPRASVSMETRRP
jgi:hypothetical protein